MKANQLIRSPETGSRNVRYAPINRTHALQQRSGRAFPRSGAVAPAARCKKLRRGSFISIPASLVSLSRFQLVPYRGAAPAMQDLIAGQIDLMFDPAVNSLPHVRGGNIKAQAQCRCRGCPGSMAPATHRRPSASMRTHWHQPSRSRMSAARIRLLAASTELTTLDRTTSLVPFAYSALMFAALIIGHHFSISFL
jgi:hypothetical protein